MKYDDAGWHYGGDFPPDLAPEAGATHIGMFVAWALLNGLGSDDFLGDVGDEIDGLTSRALTPGQWFIHSCDEALLDQMLSERGNAFARFYYGTPDDAASDLYIEDYSAVFDGIERFYFVEDNWANYDKLAPVIAGRLADWEKPA